MNRNRPGAVYTNRGHWIATRALIVSVTIALVCAGCSKGPEPVVVSAVHDSAISLTAGGSGTVTAATDVPVLLGFRGTVTGLAVAVGQSVQAGQVLVAVSSSGLDNIAGKRGARYHALAARLARLLRLGEPAPLISDARSQLAQAQAAYAVAVANRGVVRSPIAGTVAAVGVSPGSTVTADQPLLHVVDLSHLTVTAPLAIEFLGRIKVGMAGSVRSDALPGSPLPGSVVAVAPAASKGGLTFAVVVSIARPAGAAPLGVSAYLSVPVVVQASVAVNQLAVLNADASPTVFVVQGNRVQQRSVTLGVSDGSTTQVLSGLSFGESVVIAGAQSLVDGSSVTVSGSQAGP